MRGDGDESAVGAAGGAAVGVGRSGGAAEGTGRPGTPAGGTAGGREPIGERDRAVKDAEMRAEALRAMSVDEGLSVREAVEWCGTGITVREVSRLRRLAGDPSASRWVCDG